MIGEKVRRRREELGLTGAQLAERAGMAPSAVSQIETGKRNPSSTSVVKLAEALGLGVGELFPKAQAPLSFEDLVDEQDRKREVKREQLEGELDNTLAQKLQQQLDTQLKALRERQSIARSDKDLHEAAKDFHYWWLFSFDWLSTFLRMHPENQWPQLEEVVNKASRAVSDEFPEDAPTDMRDMTEVLEEWSARQDTGV